MPPKIHIASILSNLILKKTNKDVSVNTNTKKKMQAYNLLQNTLNAVTNQRGYPIFIGSHHSVFVFVANVLCIAEDLGA